ncbi:Flp family type IVb pilin [Saccharothrix variisporea]|uniref:Pilus assembly protein Flp/PilA n=1 Tax=Saccharothrix variisporea TaxID=543527 RepID=A0A495XCL3_9PSEU|nr:Flp family type IVb pilin [Saccharothrix variisporea]RKT70574.1 pilus assembly protein Flp/PilA [Saccharothrix variisporea]
MLTVLLFVRNFLEDRLPKSDRGATAVEYGLMVALIAVAIIATVTAVGDELNTLFEDVVDGLNGP